MPPNDTVDAPAPAPAVDSGSAIPPSGQGEIHVVPPPVEPVAAKPGSAMARMRAELAKRAKPAPGQAAEEAAAAPAPAPATAPESGDQSGQAADGAEGAAAPESSPQTKPAAKTKVNPWKLVDEWKQKYASVEKELSDTKSRVTPESDRKALEESRSKMEARVRELEQEIRYVNYTKSEEFQTKYQKPYEDAWGRAMNELRELQVATDDQGNSRPLAPQDILQLVNAPLPQAKEMARAMFGDFADDVMRHRMEIRSLFDQQTAALAEARKNGEARFKEISEKLKSFHENVSRHVAETWQKANEAAVKDERHGKFFAPVEGDEEGNARLAKGYELVDRAFKENAMDPKLKPEERAAIVRRHAAVRNRAAAFGRLVYNNEQLQARVVQLEGELSKYKSSTPPTGGGQAAGTTAAPAGSRFEQIVRGPLQRIAK